MGWLIKAGESDGIKVFPANGKEFTKEAVMEVINDKEAYGRIKGRAARRGLTIGAIEGVTAGLSRGVGASMVSGAGKKALTATAKKRLADRVSGTAYGKSASLEKLTSG